LLDARLSSLQFLRELASEGSGGKISSAITSWEAREGYSKPDVWTPRAPILYRVQDYNSNSPTGDYPVSMSAKDRQTKYKPKLLELAGGLPCQHATDG
jgi:hypothetical protein